MKKIFLFLAFLLCCGCNNCRDDFRDVPVTNNPNIVPSYGNSLPGMPTFSN